MRCNIHEYKPMKLIFLDSEDDKPEFIEDQVFNVRNNIEDLIHADFDFLEEDEESEENRFIAIVLGLSYANR